MESYNFKRIDDKILVYEDNEKWKFLLLLLNPFLAYVVSFFTLKEKSSIRVLFLFFVLFGFSLVVKLSNPEDCSRYLGEYLQFCSNPKENFRIVWQDYFGNPDQRTVKDIYQYILFYICARILPGNYHLVWGINSIVFAYFYTKSLAYITRLDNYHKTWPLLILTLVFMFSNPIYNSSSIRFFTASWIAVYATLKIVVDKKIVYFVLLALTPLVHSTFMIYVAFVIISIIIKQIGMPLLTVIFILSFVFSTLALNFVVDFKDILPPIIQRQIWSYVESDTALTRILGVEFDALPLYAKVFTRLPHYFETLLLIILIIKNKVFNNESNRVLKYLIAYFSLVNFISIIPSCARFYTCAIPFIVFLWIANYRHLLNYNKLLLFAPLVYSYSILYWMRKMFLVIDPTIFVLPYPIQLLKTLLLT